MEKIKTIVKINSLFSYIHNRYLHFLWKILKKRKVNIAEKEITYVIVYKWFLIGGLEAKTPFVDAMCLVHRPTKTAMIFVTKNKHANKWLRYTLLHEYMECCYALGGKDYLEKQKLILRNFLDLIEREVPHFTKALENSNCTRGHGFALIYEMDLALKEMRKDELELFIADIIKNRL